MKLLIFALVLAVILQAMAAPIESWKIAEDEIDRAELHQAIKNVGKVEKALKAVEASQNLEKIALHQRTMKSLIWPDEFRWAVWKWIL